MVEKSSRMFDQLLNALKCPSTKESQLPPIIIRCQQNSRNCFPLGFGHATNYIQKGVALVGWADMKFITSIWYWLKKNILWPSIIFVITRPMKRLIYSKCLILLYKFWNSWLDINLFHTWFLNILYKMKFL